MVPFDVVTSCLNVLSDSNSVVMFREGFEMFSFTVVKSLFRFPNGIIIALSSTSFIYELWIIVIG